MLVERGCDREILRNSPRLYQTLQPKKYEKTSIGYEKSMVGKIALPTVRMSRCS